MKCNGEALSAIYWYLLLKTDMSWTVLACKMEKIVSGLMWLEGVSAGCVAGLGGG